MRNVRRFLGGGVLWLLLAAGVEAAREETFVAGQRVRLKTVVPTGYSFVVEPSGEGVTTVELENPVWRIALRVYISDEVPPEATTAEWQRNLVVQQAAMLLTQSKEQDYRWADLGAARGSGVYCVFTDATARKASELPPDGYLHVVAGAKVIRGAVMYFTIYCNDLTTPEYREVFDLLVNGFDRG